MVYFILEWNSTEEYVSCVKIGRADSPEGRLSALQTGNPRRLELWFAIPGGEDIEARFHSYFENVHIRLEWFKYSFQLMKELFEYLENPHLMAKRERFMLRLPLEKCFTCELRCVHNETS